MNNFAGNITIKWNPNISWLDFEYVENLSKQGNKVLYVSWKTEIKTSKWIVEMLEEKFGELVNYDISIETEEKLKIFSSEYEEWVYELASFEWEQVDYNEILDRFREFDWVSCVREAENSKRFWNKVIKVDFIY